MKVREVVGPWVLVGVEDRVGVGVTVSVGVLDEVDVCVAVKLGVIVELPASMTTSWGGWLPWREEKTAPSVLSAASTKLKVPFPDIREVTLYSTQVFVLILPLLSSTPLVRAGRLFQVIPVSVHEVLLA